jgi:hypothetical protein
LVTLLVWPPFEQVMVTGQEPGVVRVPTFQVQLTTPVEPAVLFPKPLAVEGPDLYSTTIEQAALGEVLAVAVA